jgi:glucokinase
MTSLLHLFNPEVLVIGGGVTNLGDLLLEPMHKAMREHVIYEAYYSDLRIEAPHLGQDVCLVGAAALVQTGGGQARLSEL